MRLEFFLSQIVKEMLQSRYSVNYANSSRYSQRFRSSFFFFFFFAGNIPNIRWRAFVSSTNMQNKDAKSCFYLSFELRLCSGARREAAHRRAISVAVYVRVVSGNFDS